MAQHTSTEIVIRGSTGDVMALAFDLPRWPSFLPHYRWVRILEAGEDRTTVEMACWRTGIPLRWRSHVWVRPDQGRMTFRHIAGPARGMAVEWTVRQEGEKVRVTIRHDLTLEAPLIRWPIGQWVVSELFVTAVAGRTLAGLKRAVEESLASGRGH